MIQKERLLHIVQMLKNLNPITIAWFGDTELIQQVQELEQEVQNELL